MRILQFIGWALLLFTGMLGIYELVEHWRHGGRGLIDVGRFWVHMAPSTLAPARSFIEGLAGSDVWHWFLRLPVMVVIAFLAAVCLAIDYSSARRRSIT